MVPDSTLNSESCPTKGSAMVRNTYASGCPASSAVTSTCWSPAVTVTGRSAGDGPISQMKSASRSTPTPVTAEPSTTGNSVPSSTSWARVRSSSSIVGTSPDR